MSVPEAELKKTDAGLIPQGDGWFVLNARDATWIRIEERGQDRGFEVVYAANEVAAKHDASVLEDTSSPNESPRASLAL